MSNNSFDADLEAILSEFSDYSKSLDIPQAQRTVPKTPAERPQTSGEAERIIAEFTPEPMPEPLPEPTTEPEPAPELEPEPELPSISAAAEAQTPPMTDTQRIRLRMRGVPLTEAAGLQPQSSEGKAVRSGAERVQTESGSDDAPKKKERQALSLGSRIGGGIIGLVFMAISVLVLSWVLVNVHPNSSSAAASANGTKISLPDKLDGYMNNLASDVLGELTYIKKIYTIQESDTAGPMPSEACYGTISIDSAEDILPVIEKARSTGLLDGQELIFSPDINFYYDSAIKYYCDETILAICWKELIDGNTVSCCEVKIADASQLRRKIADDTYGSPNQYYASSLSKQANAVVAMNADFYQFRDFGIVVYQRELYRYSAGNYTGNYSFYNCIDNCFINSKGEFIFMHKGEEISEEALRQFIADNDILFSIAFGPILVENGEVQPCTWYPAGEPTTGYSRAGIGVVDELHYFYMNLNHSPEKAARWTVTQFAEHMHEKGIDTAYGLDGGQTGELVYKHQPYNYIDFGSERLVSDIIYFATAIPEEEALR